MSVWRRGVLVVCLCVLVSLSVAQPTQAAEGGLVGIWSRMSTQVSTVWTIALDTASRVFGGNGALAAQVTRSNNTLTGPSTASYGTSYVPVPVSQNGVLAINAPLQVAAPFTVTALTQLATTTISGPLAAGAVDGSSAAITGQVTAGGLRVGGQTSLLGELYAGGGVRTGGAAIDLEGGELSASNVLYGIEAGTSVRITGDPQRPRISVDLNRLQLVTSINGEDGEVDFRGVDDIRISGTRIYNESTLNTVRARGGCAGCIVDSDVSDVITIAGGTVDNTPIGQTTPATAAFTAVTIGASSTPATLTAYATTTITGTLTVSSATTSQFTGGINVTGGCVSVDGSCIGGATVLTDLTDVSATSSASGDLLQYDGTVWRNVSPASLGIGAIAYSDLSDTPSTYVAHAVTYVNDAGDGLDQSADFVFDGTNLSIGTTSAYTQLTLAGDLSVLGGSVRWYNDAGYYAAFTATSSASSDTTWTLPAGDGLAYQVLYTDGTGNLSFGDIVALGGGANRYTQLLDTPSTLTAGTLPFVNASGTALTQSANLIYSNDNLGVGVPAPSERLSVDGSVRFAQAGGQTGLYYQRAGGWLGLGTDSPTDRLSILGGSILQRGGTASTLYSPTLVGGISLSDTVTDIDVSGAYAYAVSSAPGDDFHVVNIKDPLSPVEVASINLVTNARAVAVRGQYAFVGTTLSGDDFHVIDIKNPTSPAQVASINMADSVNDIFLSGRYAYVVTDAAGNDFHVIDLRDPLHPVEVGSVDLPDSANGVTVAGDYAYVVTSTNGDDLHVIDISDPAAPTVVGATELNESARKIVVEGGYAYVTTDSATEAMQVVDVTTPTSPTVVGVVALVTSARGIAVSGKYAYVTSLGTSYDFHVIDIEDPAAPVLVGQVDPAAGDGLGVRVVGRYAYMTSTAGGNDIHVIDISGATFQAATVYSISGGTMTVTADANVGGRVYAGLGIVSGSEGVQTDGSLNVLGANASYFAGSVGIGTTSTSSSLTVDGSIQSSSLLGGATNLTTDANGVIIRDPSDVRLKEHIETIDDAFDILLQLRGVRYEWKDKTRFGSQTEVGFIAQEVDTVLPEVVRKGGDYWSINTRNIIAVVVEAVKTLITKVNGNSEKIATLEQRVAELEEERGTTATDYTDTSAGTPDRENGTTGDATPADPEVASTTTASTTATTTTTSATSSPTVTEEETDASVPTDTASTSAGGTEESVSVLEPVASSSEPALETSGDAPAPAAEPAPEAVTDTTEPAPSSTSSSGGYPQE